MKKAIYILLFLPLSFLGYGQSKVTIKGGAGSGGGTVDQVLSSSSTNAVSSAAVSSALNTKLGTTPSQVWPGGNSYNINPTLGSSKPIEIFNIGESAATGNPTQQIITGIGKNNWSMEQTWNVWWDNAATKWKYGSASHPQHMIENGWEGVTIHAVPPGTNFQDTWHETFQVRAEGVDGTTGLNSGVYIQNKTTSYWKYKSGTYTGDDTHPWTGGTSRGDDPFIWLHSEEIKGTTGEYIRFEQNSGTASGGQLYFKKSRGTYASKITSNSGDNAGFITFSLYDGATYQNTARITSSADANAASGVVPQSLLFQTSATNSAGLATRMKIKGNGQIVMTNVPTYADEAAATAAGLESGTIYKTSTGVLMIKL